MRLVIGIGVGIGVGVGVGAVVVLTLTLTLAVACGCAVAVAVGAAAVLFQQRRACQPPKVSTAIAIARTYSGLATRPASKAITVGRVLGDKRCHQRIVGCCKLHDPIFDGVVCERVGFFVQALGSHLERLLEQKRVWRKKMPNVKCEMLEC